MTEEDRLHIAIADYLRLVLHNDVLWWHCPNGGRRNVVEAVKLKKMGVKAGIPDITLMWSQWIQESPQTGVGFIEVKTEKGHLTKEQKEFKISAENMLAGFEIARSIDDVTRIIKSWRVPVKFALK